MGDPILESNLTRRVDFALFMVEALENDSLAHEAPAIVGRQTPSALAHATSNSGAMCDDPHRVDGAAVSRSNGFRSSAPSSR